MLAVALTIAGSDPSGGAGIQADLKTFHQFGVYGEAVIALLTVQNTESVQHVELVPANLVSQQIDQVVSDIPPAAAKTGALGSVDIVRAVADAAASFAFPLVVDPVMISKHGARLMSSDAEQALKKDLVPRALLVTPNIPEAEALTNMKIRSQHDMQIAGNRIRDLGCHAVLVKGGHFEGEPVDILCAEGICEAFPAKRVSTRHTHGTGCTYSAAITAGLALGLDLVEAIRIAKAYIQSAIENAPGLGRGHGPVNHFAKVAPINTSAPSGPLCRSMP